jgi:thioredoxin 1
MFDRRILLVTAALSLAGFAAFAADKAPFTTKSFAAAQAAGDSILVHVNAPWCPTCKAQKPILEKLEKDPKFSRLKVFTVDFDSQKDAVRSLKATTQSTLITFKGATETGRSVGDTEAGAIEALMEKAL